MIKPGLQYGFAKDAWEAGKSQARQMMISCARRKKDISYSELVAGITHVALAPHDPRLAHFLGEIAIEEDAANRGLLTVVVVHKSGDKMPGPGFFEMAASRGRDVSDKEAVWVREMKKVQAVWAKK